ncbi:flagellar basal body P-ring protein FlgI [Polynucleobacter corsicus]|uniref:flagellar basal body P-ring protein FlgI n=1 Tax=Polynucleobacter corsicus TaxID=2081042 RepID=UPI001BFD9D32|nr:flagellar basal body P-ring protein FlgI [Polynucleobacter corsicus]QWE19673.1 flagellar basal body P-ring protein FlgI [Polynucleobacter corsicus]
MKKILITFAALMLQLAIGNFAQAERIREIADFTGQRTNQLVGYGLVVGLDGTGDLTIQTPFTLQSIRQMLSAMGVTIPESDRYNNQTWLRNIAAVMVTADLPAYPKPGQKMDVTVSAMGSSRSLKGGTLVMTPMRGADGQVYAQAQGSLIISGHGVANLNAKQNNHLSAGRIPAGGLIEKGIPAEENNTFVELNLKNSDFSLMQRTTDAITRRFGANIAVPIDGRSMTVRTPENPVQRMNFLAALQELDIPLVADSAKVVLNSRTGSVVMNQGVRLGSFAAAHGNLSLRVEVRADQSRLLKQPPPFTGEATTFTSVDNLNIDRGSENALKFSGPSVSLEEVVKALNMLGATPQDLIAILQAMKSAGALKADIEVI